MYFSIPKRSLSKLALTSIEVSWERQKERKEVVEIKINFPLHDALDWHFGDGLGGGGAILSCESMSIDLPLSLSFFLSSSISFASFPRASEKEERKGGQWPKNIYWRRQTHTKKQKAKINNYFMIYKRQGEGSRR